MTTTDQSLLYENLRERERVVLHHRLSSSTANNMQPKISYKILKWKTKHYIGIRNVVRNHVLLIITILIATKFFIILFRVSNFYFFFGSFFLFGLQNRIVEWIKNTNGVHGQGERCSSNSYFGMYQLCCLKWC